MILNTPLEARLYTRESADLPPILKERLAKIQLVYQPESAQDIQEIFSCSRKKGMPVIPRGAATSGMGGILPLKKSIMADLCRLNKILDLDLKNKTVNLEAGVRWWDLKQFLKRHSLDLFTSPTSLFSTVGGWLSTGGYGINSFQHGHIGRLVESVEIMTPDKTSVLNSNDRRFKLLLGSEGQLGILTRVKLKVREQGKAKPHLVFFKNTAEAVEFLSELLKSEKIEPVHVSYFDNHRLAHKNLLLKAGVSFPKSEGILVVFEDGSSPSTFFDLIEKKRGTPAEEHLTAFLWNERFFPFSIKHFYSSFLGCESILAVKNLPRYMDRVRRFGENSGISLSTEATLISRNEAVVFTIFPTDPEKLAHLLHLLLTYSLSHIAVSCGGRPYGIGVWNLPLLRRRFSRKDHEQRRLFKREADPLNLINPAKSYSPDWRISSPLKLGYSLAALLSGVNPLLKAFSGILNSEQKEKSSQVEACSNCGACVNLCPSYLINRTEIVSAKGKLFLLKELQRGSRVPPSVAQKAFLCIHCRLCEYACQSKLELMPVWDTLEQEVEKIFGRPEDKIKEFIKQVESDPACSRLFDSLAVSLNSHDKVVGHV